jgi:hypothetical protein
MLTLRTPTICRERAFNCSRALLKPTTSAIREAPITDRRETFTTTSAGAAVTLRCRRAAGAPGRGPGRADIPAWLQRLRVEGRPGRRTRRARRRDPGQRMPARDRRPRLPTWSTVSGRVSVRPGVSVPMPPRPPRPRPPRHRRPVPSAAAAAHAVRLAARSARFRVALPGTR